MAVSKIIKVRNIYATVRYCTKEAKTNFGEFITTHECCVPFVARQFNEITQERRSKSSRDFSIEAWMIFQSFAEGEIEPAKAHELGIEFAKRYLGNNHQFMVTTHVDAGHIHNHIVFNATDFNSFKSFDSRDKHIITDLRKVNDSICEENNLSVIKEPKGKGISQREYYARKNTRSYKARLEKLIDKAISNSDTYRDFLDIMDRNCEVKFGQTLAFKFPGQDKFTRLSRLGIDYSENSIKLRIKNKSLQIVDMPKISELIDKSSSIFQGKDKTGLNRWATRQNIDTLANMSHIMHTENITSEEYQRRKNTGIKYINDIDKRIEIIDSQISLHESYIEQEQIYRSSFVIMQGYKQAQDKAAYKKEHYADFKRYDKAKSIVLRFKDEKNKLPRPETVKEKLEELIAERTILYTEYQIAKQQFASNLQIDKIKQKSNDIGHDEI